MTAAILIYHGKYGDQYWLVDTPERLEAAQRGLFAQLDEWGCYESDGESNVMLEAARGGDIRYIRHFLEARRDYEYEGWDIEQAIDPCA